MQRRVLQGLAILSIVGVVALQVATTPSNDKRPAPPLPPTVLQPPKATIAGLRGEPALIHFWASWCTPCREEAPALERFYRSAHRGGLVAVDYTDQADAARSFIDRYGWTFPILSDANGVYGDRYGLPGLPVTVALDARGRIVETLFGPQPEEELRRALASASRG